jgi:hypothetical protein
MRSIVYMGVFLRATMYFYCCKQFLSPNTRRVENLTVYVSYNFQFTSLMLLPLE